MFDFEEIQSAKAFSSTFEKKRLLKAEELYKEALSYIKEFRKNKDNKKINLAVDKLYEVIKNNRKHTGSYVWLAYVFHIINKDKIAIKYLKLAELFEPDFPQIIKLKALITKPKDITDNKIISDLSEVLNYKKSENIYPEAKDCLFDTIRNKIQSLESPETKYNLNKVMKNKSSVRILAHSFVNSFLNI